MAYVRIRPAVLERGVAGTPPAKAGRSKSAGDEGDGEEESQTSSVPHESELLGEGEPGGVMAQGEQLEPSTKEEGVKPAKTHECVTTSGSEASMENPTTQELADHSKDDRNGKKLVDRISGEASQPNHCVNPQNMGQSHFQDDPSAVSMQQEGERLDEGRIFDLSSVDGQWYYISDSQVSAVSENKVLSSQAFLLFYERLPLINSTGN